MNRNEFMKAAAGAAVSLAARAQQSATPQTYTYKTAAGCDIKADVYGADSAVRKPVVIFIHGGALIMGSRKGVMLNGLHVGLLNSGYVVVSIDYRLAPEIKLPAIIDDVRDAHRWCGSPDRSCFTSTRTGWRWRAVRPEAT